MIIKPDKNGEPFGYDDACRGQLRIGGNDARVKAFFAAHPEIAKAAGKIEPPAVDSGQESKPVELAKKTGGFTLFEG
jgi:hypothetical protein